MKKIIVIGGATASGKTAMSIALAKYYNTEILSADSRQCFREMKIGTAAPNEEELYSTTHHFVQSHSIHDDINAGMYERYALELLSTLFLKLDIVIVVGGTGLYLKSLCDGIDEMPPINKEIERDTVTQYKLNGIEWLQAEITKNDVEFYQHGEMQNPHRMLRALIFAKTHNQSILNFRRRETKYRNFEIARYTINVPRDILYQRINDRVDKMIEDGLVDEAIQLIDYQQNKNLNTVGYQEIFNFLNQTYSLEKAIELIKQHTRNYAKRQMTWFKNQGDYKSINSIEEIIHEELGGKCYSQ
jgi:tRNA dimethylallyltransferase